MSAAEGEGTAELVERRISLDGGHYTIEQFVEFFGEADAQWYWEQAEISTQVFGPASRVSHISASVRHAAIGLLIELRRRRSSGTLLWLPEVSQSNQSARVMEPLSQKRMIKSQCTILGD